MAPDAECGTFRRSARHVIAGARLIVRREASYASPMQGVWVLVILTITGCRSSELPRANEPAGSGPGSTRGVAPRTTGSSNAIHGWWQVPDDKAAGDMRNATLRLTAEDLAVILPDGRVFVRECPVAATGNTGTISNCNGEATLMVTGDTLEFRASPREHYVATRIPRTQIAELEATLAKHRPPRDACVRARACYRAAMVALGEPGNEERELAHAPGSSDCVMTVRALRSMLDDKRLDVPAECQGIVAP